MIHFRTWGEDKWYKNLIAVSIENPLKTWWKARKFFKFPFPKITILTCPYHFPYASKHWQGKLLDIDIHDVVWKDKYDSPRHERNPLIYICLFGRFSLWVVFSKKGINEFGEKEDKSIYYWEYLLDYLYYSKSLKLDSFWSYKSKIFSNYEDGTKKSANIYVPTHLFSLNKKGLKEFKKLYKK